MLMKLLNKDKKENNEIFPNKSLNFPVDNLAFQLSDNTINNNFSKDKGNL